MDTFNNVEFSVPSAEVLWLQKWNLQHFEESMAHWNIIAFAINSFSSSFNLEHQNRKKKADFTLLSILVIFSINYASHCLRINRKFYNNVTYHFIIIILFTHTPGSFIRGCNFHFSQHRSGSGRVAQLIPYMLKSLDNVTNLVTDTVHGG